MDSSDGEAKHYLLEQRQQRTRRSEVPVELHFERTSAEIMESHIKDDDVYTFCIEGSRQLRNIKLKMYDESYAKLTL